MKSDRKRYAFMRFGISGAVFTLLGPTLFWILYPLGPYLAAAMTEAFIHAIRFFTFRRLVFPAQKGYRVSPTRYLVSALPLTLRGLYKPLETAEAFCVLFAVCLQLYYIIH